MKQIEEIAVKNQQIAWEIIRDTNVEKVAEHIAVLLAEETRQAILRLKHETPDTEKIMDIIYYQAVIQGGARTYTEFTEWLKNNPTDGIIEWIP